MKLKFALFLVLCALAVGALEYHMRPIPASFPCGGRYSPANASAVLGLYGDSTMQGLTYSNGSHVITPENAPSDLQQLFVSAGMSVATDNEGLGGDNSSNWLNVNGETTPPCTWTAEMKTTKAQVIIMNWGINDTFQLSEAKFRASMETLIRDALAAGKTVVIETPNPVNPAVNSRVAAGLPARVAIDYQLAQKYHLTLIDEYTACLNTPGWNAMLSDGIHPTPAGYAFKARVEYQIISATPELASLLTK